MLLLPASRPARQGNFSILRLVIRVSNRRFPTRSREQLSVTTSHEARSAALRLGDSAGPLGNFSILSHSVSVSNRPPATHEASVDSTLRQLRGVGTSILDPEVGTLNECCFRWGVVLHLRGVRLSGLSASLWGEQVISYVACPGRANPGRIPGVSAWSGGNSSVIDPAEPNGRPLPLREGRPRVRRTPAPVRRAHGCAGLPTDAP